MPRRTEGIGVIKEAMRSVKPDWPASLLLRSLLRLRREMDLKAHVLSRPCHHGGRHGISHRCKAFFRIELADERGVGAMYVGPGNAVLTEDLFMQTLGFEGQKPLTIS